MPESPNTESEHDKETENQNNALESKSLVQVTPISLPIRLRWILLIGTALLIALLLVSIFLPNLAERVKFFTVNALSLLVLFVIIVQAYIYRRQWDVMEHQGNAMHEGLRQTDNIIEKMQGQLEAIDKQAGIMIEQKKVMEGQTNVMVGQANILIDSVEETRKIGIHNEQMVKAVQGQLAAMKDQAKIMGDSLVEARRLHAVGEYQAEIAALNVKVSERNASAAELSAKAGERSVEVMRESYIATTRAYIGIREIAVGALIAGQIPTLSVVWHNGGKTPASRFRANVYLVFGDEPERRGYLIDDDWSDSKASFLPPGVSNPVPYPQVEVGFKPVTKEMLEALNGGSKRLYAMIQAIYLDFTDQPRTLETSYIFNPWEGGFTELYEYQTQKQDRK